jgi:large subunit ribosomal protein L27
MAHKKGAGSTKNGRDSISKRLGVKKYQGEKVIPGNIIIRQRGLKYKIGINVKLGRDHTIYSLKEGIVIFYSKNNRTFVSVESKNINLKSNSLLLLRQVKTNKVFNF